MKTSKGGESQSKKALNYCKQGRETVKEDIAGIQHKGPCNKANPCTAWLQLIALAPV